ncbi:hypothetical protein AB0K34_11020 [Actinomadura sp. NPDC049382]|uniref:hypothetical protein n=1 Tax=Actinomadura sp. NPDC049382 TaxID=3158220 RepID=UPI003435CB61
MTVAYRNTRTGRVVHLAGPLSSMDRSKRWELLTDAEAQDAAAGSGSGPAAPWPTPNPDPNGPFDPSEHTVTQVNEYLAGAELGERERVLQAEADGRGRRGILSGPYSDLTGA